MHNSNHHLCRALYVRYPKASLEETVERMHSGTATVVTAQRLCQVSAVPGLDVGHKEWEADEFHPRPILTPWKLL